MRTIAFLFPVLLASCGSVATQREILIKSKAEVAAREPWSDTAVILVEKEPMAQDGWIDPTGWFTWVVRAGAWDYSEYPSYKGINMVPGTQRELRFTRDGCLVRYSDETGRCDRAGFVSPAPVEIKTAAEGKK
ncbi:hypothetical protein OKA05_13930 [Luteolibacter arcticus]|uniref:Lipoprotein n=1 Tax=Luteolibacter arcticus TaxID=1581411 RepID=A0ABT3GJI5_9BACT|nr:hypothetical protein [Luteolibacter arcticus]MCW1923660.1 hypothetical protein [Luteolibacter arcticus]